MPENVGGTFNLDRILLSVALLGGATGTGLGLVGSDDRFYGSEGRSLEIRIEYLAKEQERHWSEIRRLDDNHPPQELLQDIGELKERMRQLEEELHEVAK